MKYKDVLRATDKQWKQDARKLIESGVDFVVINLDEDSYKFCKALAQEFNYICVIEDKGKDLEIILNNFPAKLPEKFGFTHRKNLSHKKPN